MEIEPKVRYNKSLLPSGPDDLGLSVGGLSTSGRGRPSVAGPRQSDRPLGRPQDFSLGRK